MPLSSSCITFDATCHCRSSSTLSNHTGIQSSTNAASGNLESGKSRDHNSRTRHEKHEQMSDARCHHTYGSNCIQAVCILHHCELGEYSVGHLSPKFLLESCQSTTPCQNVFPRPCHVCFSTVDLYSHVSLLKKLIGRSLPDVDILLPLSAPYFIPAAVSPCLVGYGRGSTQSSSTVLSIADRARTRRKWQKIQNENTYEVLHFMSTG